MAKRVVKKDLTKKKKKKWYTLVATPEFREAEMGRTLCDDEEKLMGRVVKPSLMDLNNDIRGQHTRIKFKVKEIKGEKAFTELLGYKVNANNLKRLVKKTKKRVDDSFLTEDSKKTKLTVKTVLLTRGDAPKSVLTALRKRNRELVNAIFKKSVFEKLIGLIMTKKIQNEIKAELKKIYPLSVVDIRFLEKKIEKKY